MSEIDPVIFEFQAKVNGYLSDLRRTTAVADRQIGTQEQRIKSLERQFVRSSGAISGHLRGLAGSFAAYLGGRELVGLIDGLTRVQNQLRVAGLEGEELAKVQERLFGIANKYGVEIGAIADVYAKAADAGKELGASQGQLLTLTGATAQALKITGVGAAQAQGAILGLGQALASGTVRAEEFNQINEGGLRPLLQAAAASERWGGSVAKLRKDMLDGKVASDEFFRAILQNAAQLESKAAKSTLTLSGAFTTLNNKMTEYVGSAASSQGATGALTSAIALLAEHLGDVIPALAVIAGAIGVRYVAGAAAAAGATVLASDAIFAMQARMAGAATTAEALGFALGGARFGIAAAAVLALGVAFVALRTDISDSARATGAYWKAQDESAAASKTAADAADKLATAHGKARKEALALARAEAENIKKKLESARASVVLAQSELQRAKASSAAALTRAQASLSFGGEAGALGASNTLNRSAQQETEAKANFDAASKTVKSLEESLSRVTAQINGAAPSAVSSTGTEPGKKSRGRSGGKDGGTDRAGQSAARVQDEIERLDVDRLRLIAELTNSAEARAAAEEAAMRADRASFDRQIALDKDLTAAQRNDLVAARDAADAQRGRAIQVQKAEELARERFSLESAGNAGEQELVSARGRVNDRTARERRMTELRLIDLEFSQREDEALREYSDASRRGDEVAAMIAQAKLARIDELKALAIEEARLQNMTPLEKLRDELNLSGARMNEALEDVQARGLRSLEDGMTEAIRSAKDLGDVFGNVADQIISDLIRIAVQQAIIKPLAELLGGSGGSGGFLTPICGSLNQATAQGFTTAGGTIQFRSIRS